jgi:hypothetical protein
VYTPQRPVANMPAPLDSAPPPAPVTPPAQAAASAARPAATELPREIVIRPDGMRRGVWEAPSWFFPTFAAMLVVASAVYGAHRMGWLRRKPSAPPPSSRSHTKRP